MELAPKNLRTGASPYNYYRFRETTHTGYTQPGGGITRWAEMPIPRGYHRSKIVQANDFPNLYSGRKSPGPRKGSHEIRLASLPHDTRTRKRQKRGLLLFLAFFFSVLFRFSFLFFFSFRYSETEIQLTIRRVRISDGQWALVSISSIGGVVFGCGFTRFWPRTELAIGSAVATIQHLGSSTILSGGLGKRHKLWLRSFLFNNNHTYTRP